jgi:fructose-bisphosphate aldolase, class II
MPFVTLKEAILSIPSNQLGAVGAFNYHNIEYAQAIVAGAEAENSPAILMVSEMMAKYVGIEIMASIGKIIARKATVPIAVMLDHGTDFDLIDESIGLGLSVMYDGSRFPFEENIANTKAVVEKAHAKGLSVEGEIGSLGISEEGDEEYDQHFTKPHEALQFAEQTGIDVLAVSVGNTHGFYQGEQRIDVPRIKVIKDLVGDLPIVMHGGSDMDVIIVHDSVHAGIRKFNIATDLRVAYSEAMLKTLSVLPIPNAPPKVFTPVKDAIQKVVQQKIRLFSLKD